MELEVGSNGSQYPGNWGHHGLQLQLLRTSLLKQRRLEQGPKCMSEAMRVLHPQGSYSSPLQTWDELLSLLSLFYVSARWTMMIHPSGIAMRLEPSNGRKELRLVPATR